MRKYNNFSHSCQYKSNNSSIIITPSVFYNHQSLEEHNLTAKHIIVLCHFLLSCWRNQASWLGEERPTLDSMLSRPLKAKMVELNYRRSSKALSLTKDQLKNIFFDLEQAKLIRRVLVKNNWYILLLDEALKMYLNNNKSKKHRINKGNIICTAWLNLLKTDGGQTDFTGALILGEITYFSRVLKMKQSVANHDAEYNSCTESTKDFSPATKNDQENKAVLVSKSKGLVAYFEYDHFKNKFSFINNQTINRTISRLEKNNVIFVERTKFVQNRKVVKRMYITLNYEVIQQGVDKTAVDFIFKTDDYLSSEQLTSFYQNTPPFIYSKYNNKTIIYPKQGFSNNFVYSSSILSSSCLANYYLIKQPERTSFKKWYHVTCLDNDEDNDDDNDSDSTSSYKSSDNNLIELVSDSKDKNRKNASKYKQINSLSFIKSFSVNKRAFRVPRHLRDMQTSLKRLYKAYFSRFNYPLSFCCLLLDSLAKKYPDVSFKGENQFITYFRKIIAQEKRASWQVRSRNYFEKALSLADLAYDKLPSVLKNKLNEIATNAGKRIEDLPALLVKLATKNAKHLFSCVSSFLSYMKQVLLKLKSKEEIQEAYRALPRASIAKVSNYLSEVEASYHRVGMQEHLRRKLASTLPMTVAYHLLHSCNFYSARVDDERNFIIPSKNKNWAQMLKGGFKNIIKDQVAAVYGTIKAIKFVQYLKGAETAKEELTSSDDTTTEKTISVKAERIKIAAKLINEEETVSSYSGANSNYYHSIQNEPISYELFQKKRLQEEQKQREQLAAKLDKEEQELKNNNVNPAVYEKYKQAVKETEKERDRFIASGGVREIARELYKVLSFSEWMQLQELLVGT